MIDYKAGDLVVCVDASPHFRTPHVKTPFKEGRLYLASCIKTYPLGAVGVVIDGHPAKGIGSWLPARFRKANPDSHETDAEFLAAVRGRRNVLSLPAPKKGERA